MSNYNTLQFFVDDYPKTLFPLQTTLILLQNAEQNVSDYIYQKILNPSEREHSFLSQNRVFASKTGLHLRRTVKLDPVAEYFIYDIVYRNRFTFKKDFLRNRRSYGYRFEKGQPLSSSTSYGEFRKDVATAKNEFKFNLRFDVATYFNALYHHDIVAWFSNGRAESDVEALGQFLREANAGRTVDCLPHGLYPCKMIGAEFLKLIDNLYSLKSSLLLRFMDDFYLFDNDEQVLSDDFLRIQRILGEKALSLNANKTVLGHTGESDIPSKIDNIKLELLQIRRRVIEVSGDDVEVEKEQYKKLNEKQTEYLLSLLKDPDIDEADAELVLVLLRDHGEDVLERMYGFLERFPSLSRKVYSFSRFVDDKEELAKLLFKFVKTGRNVTEDQLFWIGKIAEEILDTTEVYPALLIALYEHEASTVITKAKILEIPELRFSMGVLREEHLKVGKSDWLAWAAAVGTRKETAISRNHLLSYFSKGSPMNRLIGECVKSLP